MATNTRVIRLLYAFAVHMPIVIIFANLSAGMRVLEHSKEIFLSWIAMGGITLVTVVPTIKLAGLWGAAWGIAMIQLFGTLFLAWKLMKTLRAPQSKH
jgi:hypothetical protein